MVNRIEESFENRTDLTEGEKDAIRCYRDLEYPQNTWSIRTSGRSQKDCDVINSCLRNPKLKKSLQLEERKLLNSLIIRLTRAINKSTVPKKTVIYKGLQDFPELKKFKKDYYVTDYGFNSFSTSLKVAKRYAGKNKDGEYIYFILLIKKDVPALYIDSKEDEWLLQKGLTYYVRDVVREKNGVLGKAIVYYLEI